MICKTSSQLCKTLSFIKENISCSSISMCGLPVSPVPLSTFWTQSLEERVEVWERTKWTWETTRLGGSPVAQVCVM